MNMHVTAADNPAIYPTDHKTIETDHSE